MDVLVVTDDLPQIGQLFDLTPQQLEQSKPWFPTGKERHVIFCATAKDDDNNVIGMIEVDFRRHLVDNVTSLIYAYPSPLVQLTDDPCLEFRRSCTICNLFVHPDYRRQGIATALIQHATQHATREYWNWGLDDNGRLYTLDQIAGRVLANNTAALRLLEQLGFYGSLSGYKQDGDGVIYFDKSLPTAVNLSKLKNRRALVGAGRGIINYNQTTRIHKSVMI